MHAVGGYGNPSDDGTHMLRRYGNPSDDRTYVVRGHSQKKMSFDTITEFWKF
jgi:hypothetical protein